MDTKKLARCHVAFYGRLARKDMGGRNRYGIHEA